MAYASKLLVFWEVFGCGGTQLPIPTFAGSRYLKAADIIPSAAACRLERIRGSVGEVG